MPATIAELTVLWTTAGVLNSFVVTTSQGPAHGQHVRCTQLHLSCMYQIKLQLCCCSFSALLEQPLTPTRCILTLLPFRETLVAYGGHIFKHYVRAVNVVLHKQ